jgi:hypothetical protein
MESESIDQEAGPVSDTAGEIPTGERRAFFIGRRTRKGSQLCIVVFAVSLVWYAAWGIIEYIGRGIGAPWWLCALAAVSHGLVSFYFSWGLAHSARPVVCAGEREVEWGSVFFLSGRRHRVRFDEIRSIGWKTPRRIRLDMGPSGEAVMRVAEIDKDDRQAVYDAIVQRIGGG